jgi:4-hydroxy-4-methyl-2-oxoglutarate aldolase
MTLLSAAAFDKLSCLDTCSVSNAIERFNVRLRNEGFVAGTVRARFPQLPPMLGYAATARVRTSSTPVKARCYFDRMDFWEFVESVPRPAIMVLQDLDPTPLGALVGEIHAAIGQALRCAGCVTNGAVRDLAAVEALKFPLFSRRVSVSHAYAHIVEFGGPVDLAGLTIQPGDLVHGDRNGVHTIPLEIADKVPEMVRRIAAEEGKLTRFCRSGDFSVSELSELMRQVTQETPPPAPALKS